MKKFYSPLPIILASILIVFGISRLIAYLIITKGFLSHSLFITIDGFRLHHFVYGNILIVLTGFIAIGLKVKVNPNWLALFYGIGLGLVLDEFPLWMGNINQLNSNIVFIPLAPLIILFVSLVILFLIIFNRKHPSN